MREKEKKRDNDLRTRTRADKMTALRDDRSRVQCMMYAMASIQNTITNIKTRKRNKIRTLHTNMNNMNNDVAYVIMTVGAAEARVLIFHENEEKYN